MTTITAKCVVNGAVMTGSNFTYYTVPDNTTLKISNMTITNTTGSAVSTTMYAVPAGGTAAAGTTKISSKPIAANTSYLCPEFVNQTLESGATIQGFGNGLSLMVSGILIV